MPVMTVRTINAIVIVLGSMIESELIILFSRFVDKGICSKGVETGLELGLIILLHPDRIRLIVRIFIVSNIFVRRLLERSDRRVIINC